MNESRSLPTRRRVLYSAVALSCSLIVCEIVARLILGTPWLHPGNPSEDPFLAPHPTRGYALRPDQLRRWSSEHFDVEVRTNAEGMRDEPLASALRKDLRLTAAGDSYTFGIGVEAEESWPEQLESMLEGGGDSHSVAVLNLGVPGYGAQQMRLFLEETWPEFAPQLAIVGIYASGYYRVRTPYVLKGGTLISAPQVASVEITPRGSRVITSFRPGLLRHADVWIKEHFHLLGHLLDAPRKIRSRLTSTTKPRGAADFREVYQPVLDELKRTHRFAIDNGAQLVVLAINRQEVDGRFSEHQVWYNEILEGFCREQGIPLVDPLPRLRELAGGRAIFRFPGDPHWSAAAHHVAAQMLHEEILRRWPSLGTALRPASETAHGEAR